MTQNAKYTALVKFMSDIIKIQKGDLIRLEYTGWLADTNELFDTSVEDIAKEGDIYKEGIVYGPIPLLVGSGRLFEGLDEAIIGSEVGAENEITLAPEKAAGPRDPKLVEQIPVREFLKQDIEPKMGMDVNIKDRVGMIIAISPRMVRVDFNRRFAGRSLKYKFKVICRIDDPIEKVQALIQMDYGNAEGFVPMVEGEIYSITVPDVCKYDQKWLLAKYKVVADLRESFGAKTVRFIEEYIKKEEEKKEPEYHEPPESPESQEPREPEELPSL
jgi:FKBP-type peptidyl-prolyl cis-trans isomerase 2